MELGCFFMCSPVVRRVIKNQPVMSESLIWWSVVALGLFWSVGAYNRLIRLRSDALRSFMPLAMLMQHYGDAVASYAEITTTSEEATLTQSGQALDTHAATLPTLHKAHAQFQTSLTAARTHPLDGTIVDALTSADAALQQIWQQIHPDARDTTNWKTTRQHIRPAAEAFALAITRYNVAITQFPALLIARIFGFRTATPLLIDLCI